MGNTPLVLAAGEELEILRRDKVQLTSQREAVIKALRSRMKEHLTAEEIWLEAKKCHRRVGLATVYRTLALLTNLGIVHPIKGAKGPTKYEVTRGHHGHFICLGCWSNSRYRQAADRVYSSSCRLLTYAQNYGYTNNGHMTISSCLHVGLSRVVRAGVSGWKSAGGGCVERKFRCAVCGYEFSLPYGTGRQGANLRCPKCGGLVHRADPGGAGGRGPGGGGGGWGRNRAGQE